MGSASTARPGRPLLAVLVWVGSWTMAGAAATIVLAFGLLPADVPFFAGPFLFLDRVLVALVIGPTAALILSRARHTAGWITGLIAVGFSGAALSLAVGLLLLERGSAVPDVLVGFLVHAYTWLWIPGAYLGLTVLPWYLQPERPRPRARRLAAAGGVLVTAYVAVAIAGQQSGAPRNPIALDGATDQLTVLGYGCAVGLVGLASVAVGGAVRRWRRTDGPSRTAMGSIALALTVIVAASLPLQFWPSGYPELPVLVATMAVLTTGQVLLAVAVLSLVLRSRLWGVDAAVSRGAVWIVLTAVVLVAYVVLVWVGGQLLPMGDGMAGVLVAPALALAVQPVRRWLQSRVDAIVYGPGSDPATLLTSLGAQVRAGHDALSGVVEHLRSGLRLGAVDVASFDAPDVRAAAVSTLIASSAPLGPSGGTVVELPLVVDSRSIGVLRLRALPGEQLDLRTLHTAEQLADVVAVALHLSVANSRLREASERMGQVRDEERRLLRRELHDGLGPALAGVGLGLAAARKRIDHDAPGAVRLLAELEAEVGRRTTDLRLLARSILPPQLDDGHLTAALTVLARRFEDAGVEIVIDGANADELHTDHQIAVYHVAAEALLNAYRHGQACRVDIHLASAPTGGVVLEVVDDGVGLPQPPPAGVGLRSMRERAEALGGSLVAAPRAGAGTVIRMELP